MRSIETQTFTYDERDRLTRAAGSGIIHIAFGYDTKFAYDAIGNITNKAGLGDTSGRTHTYIRAHAVRCADGEIAPDNTTTCAPNELYSYDANGNLTSGGGRTFSWAAENQPASIAVQNGVTETYLYNADNERVKRTTNGTSTFFYSGIAEEVPNQSTWRNVYTFNGHVIAERSAAGGFGTDYKYLHGDHLGSVAAASTSNTSPTLTKQYFTPWGEQRTGTNTSAISTQTTERNFTGQRKDDTGLLFYNARYYDPKLSRFISADSIVPQTARSSGDARAEPGP